MGNACCQAAKQPSEDAFHEGTILSPKAGNQKGPVSVPDQSFADGTSVMPVMGSSVIESDDVSDAHASLN